MSAEPLTGSDMPRTAPFLLLATAAFLLVVAPTASAHETYHTDDDQYELVLGEQAEPVYTYDWTNLDFIVRHNVTGTAVEDVHETVNATLIAPGGEEHHLPIEPQFGEDGRYEFVEGYYLTQPGQYQVRLEGHIQGSSVNGTYDLPGPRQSMSGFGFPGEDVPTLLDLEGTTTDLQEENRQLREENQRLQENVSTLETRVDDLESAVSALETQDGASSGGNALPGFGPASAVAALTGALLLVRRRD